MTLENTGVMCVVAVSTTDDDIRYVDMGNYFEHRGQRVLVTRADLARRYGHLVDVPIYVRKPQTESKS